MNKALGVFLKVIAAVGVLAIIVLAIAVEVYALTDIYDVIVQIVFDTSQEDTVIKDCLKSLDLVLLGVIFFTIALGLYELYVCPIANLPSWLVIETLDDLKSLMIKMVIFIMAISFAGRIVTYTDGIDILYLGASFALVTIALTYFINKK
jgi:uncharacterized membrane protein YqhA